MKREGNMAKNTTMLVETKKTMLDYLPAGKMPKEIPAGKILVHNSVRPSRRIGYKGSRAWWDDKGNADNSDKCDCGWGAELGEHYIARR
jgi:hypothetical protein